MNALLPSTTTNRYKERTCASCQSTFIPRRHDQLYCGQPSTCKTDGQNLELTRGKQAYRALYHLVTCKADERGEFLALTTQLARAWRDEDRAKGAPLPPLPERIATRRRNAAYEARKAAAREHLTALGVLVPGGEELGEATLRGE